MSNIAHADTHVRRQLDEGLAALHLDLPAEARDKLLAYGEMLLKWNRTYNLTALRDREKMVSHHLLDSLAILPFIEGDTLLDVGSGGGLPGIPLAIVRPGLRVTLCDTVHKKTAFLRQAAIELGLVNVAVHCGRVEDLPAGERFSAITSRAFADLGDFVRAAHHLLAPGGAFYAMKGVHPHEEIANLPPGYTVAQAIRLDVPGVDGARHLIIVREK